ncbi:hydrolase [Sphingomonas bacterium]|uniref:hydrolase n=1 Tax=Sphingomonas bacterium TaxID=1895847 RepID=UPI0015757D4C|nr:hydrolase [Sphingomonas bacterium]
MSAAACTDAECAMLASIEAAGPAMIARAIDWCAISSGSGNAAGLSAMLDLLQPAFAALPGTVERLPVRGATTILTDGSETRGPNAEALRLTVRPDAPIQVVLTGHVDTVYPVGSGFERTVTRADGALNGPGIADMKGGLSVMLGALEAFERHPVAARLGYRVLLSPDEEVGSPGSASLLAEIARGAQVGMTYEPALADGTLVSARKGTGNFHVVFRGRAAHAGRDFAAGRNAIAAAARLAGALDRINGTVEGVTVNVARIDGGGPLNVVPDMAVLRLNVRFPDRAAADALANAIDRCVAETGGDGITVTLHGGFTRPAKPFDARQQALFGSVREVGALLGLSLAWQPTGGVCEGNNLHGAGLANVDTLGVRGGAIHSSEEHAWPESFIERAQLSALLLAKLATGEMTVPTA